MVSKDFADILPGRGDTLIMKTLLTDVCRGLKGGTEPCRRLVAELSKHREKEG